MIASTAIQYNITSHTNSEDGLIVIKLVVKSVSTTTNMAYWLTNLVIFGIPSYYSCKLYILIFFYKLNVCFRWRK